MVKQVNRVWVLDDELQHLVETALKYQQEAPVDKRDTRLIRTPVMALWVVAGFMLLATVGCGGGGGGGGSLSSGTSTGITSDAGTGGILPIGGGTVPAPTAKKDTERTYQATTNLAIQGRSSGPLKGLPQVSPLGRPMAKPLNLKEVATSKEAYQGTLSQAQWFAYYQVGGADNVVPAGTEVSVSLAGPSNADFDLYIKAGDLPTTSSYDDRGFSPSSTERVHTITDQPCRVYVLVVAYSGTGSYALTCDQSVSLPQATSVTLTNNAGTATGTLATNGSYSRFVIPAVPDQARLTVTSTGPDGTDFDLFARVGAPPTFRIADTVAVGNSSSDVLNVTNRSGATRDVYVTVLSASGTGDFTLQFALTLAPANEISALTPGTPASGSLTRPGDYRLYRISSVPANTQLNVDLQGPDTADFDLFVRLGSVPTLCATDSVSVNPSSTEHCVVRTGAQVQDAYVLVRSFRGSGIFTVTASTTANPTQGGAIIPGTPATGSLDSEGAQVVYYVADVAPNTYLAGHLTALQTSVGADFDLYIRLNQPPTTTDYDARGSGVGCVEHASLTVTGTETIKAYFMVRSYRGTGGFQLMVDPPTPTPTTITLPTAQAPVTTVNASLAGSGDSVLFKVPTVPDQTTLAFDLTGPASGADFDLFVRRGSPPTATLLDGMGMSPTSTEHCVVTTNLPNQDVYVRVRSFIGSGAFTLTVRCVTADITPITLGDPVNGTVALAGDNFMYVARAVPASTNVTAHLVGPVSGADFDLYIRKGAPPTLDTYDARGNTAGADESVATLVSSQADVYIWVRSSSGSGAFTLTTGPTNGNSGSSSTTLLSSGTPVSGALDTQLAIRYYRIDVPANSDLQVALTPGTNPVPAVGTDFDLYVRKGEMPTTSLYDAVGFSPTCSEQCRVSVTTAQTVFIMVKSYAGTGSFNLVATATPVVVTPPPAGAGRYFLVTIGINDYPGTSSDLTWCVKDMEDLKAALPGVASTMSAHLRDSAATKAAIQQKILDLKNGTNGMTQIGSGDTLVLAYSGHGSNSGGLGYIVVWGSSTFDYISSTELQSWLGDLPTDTRKIVMLDSCYSGKFVNRAVSSDVKYRFVPMKGSDPHFSGQFFGATTRTRSLDALSNLVGLMACAGTEYSMESSSIQNGAYTHYLVQGLGATNGVYGPADANSNHSITVSEASAYATPRVTASFSSQHPQFWDGGGAYSTWVLKF